MVKLNIGDCAYYDHNILDQSPLQEQIQDYGKLTSNGPYRITDIDAGGIIAEIALPITGHPKGELSWWVYKKCLVLRQPDDRKLAKIDHRRDKW